MKNLTELKKYPMAEAIYIEVFDTLEEDLKNRPREEVIMDYEYLEENVAEALETLSELEQLVLQRVLGEKQTLSAVGKEIDRSRTRVSRIVAKAFQRLHHPYRVEILDGTRRRRRIEAEAEEQRKEGVKENWEKVGAEIIRQKERQQAQIDAFSLRGVECLRLTTVCKQKLSALEVNTVGELLDRFPFDPQTNGLTGLAIADGIEESDYQEIWGALFMNGLLVHLPELPDFDAIRKTEQSAKIRDMITSGTVSPEIIAMHIRELELSVRSYNCVARSGIWTVGELLERLGMSADEYVKLGKSQMVGAILGSGIRNLGRKSSEEVANRLHEVLNGEF